jgi:hypothetical protein
LARIFGGAEFNLLIALLEVDEASLDAPPEEKYFATVDLAGPLREVALA